AGHGVDIYILDTAYRKAYSQSTSIAAGMRYGVAKKASIISVKVSDDEGFIDPTSV
ncbi:hypothetical protein C0991_005361, partial [Blastosporella zonata]